jgi:hypothetical protein
MFQPLAGQGLGRQSPRARQESSIVRSIGNQTLPQIDLLEVAVTMLYLWRSKEVT